MCSALRAAVAATRPRKRSATALRATAARRAPRNRRHYSAPRATALRAPRARTSKTALRATAAATRQRQRSAPPPPAARRPPRPARAPRNQRPAPPPPLRGQSSASRHRRLPRTAAATRPTQLYAPPPPRLRVRVRVRARARANSDPNQIWDHGMPHPVTGLHCCRGAGVDAARAARHDWPALTREPSTAHGALAHRAGRAHTAREAGPTALALGAVTVLLGLESDTDAQMSRAQRLLARSALHRAAAASGCRR